MSQSYRHLTEQELQDLYDLHRKNLAQLEHQAAQFGALYVPLPITNSILATLDSIDSINEELAMRYLDKGDSNLSMIEDRIRKYKMLKETFLAEDRYRKRKLSARNWLIRIACISMITILGVYLSEKFMSSRKESRIEIGLNNCEQYFNSKQFQPAIESCTLVVELDPNSFKPYYLRAEAYRNKAQPQCIEAVADYTRAIELSQNNEQQAKSYYNRAFCYRDNDATLNLDQAIQDFTVAQDKNPSLIVDVYFARGVAYEKKKDFEKARADYEFCINDKSDKGLEKRVMCEGRLQGLPK